MDRFLDEEERDIVAAYESGEFKPVKNQEAAKTKAKEAARNYLRKDTRITIRLSGIDLERLKRKAALEGMPYQTLIASVLHKYVGE